MKCNVVPDLFKRSCIAKWCDAVGPGFKSLARQSSSDRNHVLLSHSGIDKSLTHSFLQRLQGHESQVASQEHHFGIDRTCNHCFAELQPHSASNSDMASRYCSFL